MNKNVLTTPQEGATRGVKNEEIKIHPLKSPLKLPLSLPLSPPEAPFKTEKATKTL